jgi:hypothetical protein
MAAPRIPCQSGPLTFQPGEADLPILFDTPRTAACSKHGLEAPPMTQIGGIGNPDLCSKRAMGRDNDTISLYRAADSSIGLARGSIRSLRVGSTSTATPGTAATGVRNDAHRRIRPDDLKKIGASSNNATLQPAHGSASALLKHLLKTTSLPR